MKTRFALAGLLTSVVNFMLHAAAYFLLLKQFFEAHPAGSEDFRRQLVKDELVPWALGLSALAFGYLITTVVHWSGAKGWASGLKTGAVMGTLLWSGFNFGLYGSANHFSLAGTFADLVFSALCVTLSSGFAAWALHSGRGTHTATTRSVAGAPGVRAG